MKVLVTGGSGRLGRTITSHLAASHDVTNLDHRPLEGDKTPFVQADILDPNAMNSLVTGYDVVVHFAAVPHLLRDDPEKTYRVNVMGTFNMLDACARNGISRFIFASSDSTIGICQGRPGLLPDYLPLDEAHPLRPEDAYGLSKVVGEETCRSYSRRNGINVTILRPCWVWNYAANPEGYRKAMDHPENRVHGFWSYIHVVDVARAVEKALDKEWASGCEEFMLSAADTTARVPSRELISTYLPTVKDIRAPLEGRQALISCAKAEQMLGWKPEHDWTEMVP